MSNDELIFEVIAEWKRGEDKFGTYHSLHEAYAVLLEEVDELKLECWRKDEERSPEMIEHEAIQIAAIAMRIAKQFGTMRT
jgi:hypothetical protein